jgi:hypothetical protein
VKSKINSESLKNWVKPDVAVDVGINESEREEKRTEFEIDLENIEQLMVDLDIDQPKPEPKKPENESDEEEEDKAKVLAEGIKGKLKAFLLTKVAVCRFPTFDDKDPDLIFDE